MFNNKYKSCNADNFKKTVHTERLLFKDWTTKETGWCAVVTKERSDETRGIAVVRYADWPSGQCPRRHPANVPESECLPSKPVVETGRQLFTWLLVHCTITGAFVKYASRGNMAQDLRANNTDTQRVSHCSLQLLFETISHREIFRQSQQRTHTM